MTAWDRILAKLMPALLRALAILLPTLTDMVSGPLGWILTLFMSFGISYLNKKAQKLANLQKISEDIAKQVDELNTAALEFFKYDAGMKASEYIDPQSWAKAKQAFKDAAKKLTKINKPS